ANDHIAALLEFVPLHQIGIGHLALAFGAPALLLDARLAFGVKLVEAESRPGVGRRKDFNRDVHEADFQIAFPGRPCSHKCVSYEAFSSRLSALSAASQHPGSHLPAVRGWLGAGSESSGIAHEFWLSPFIVLHYLRPGRGRLRHTRPKIVLPAPLDVKLESATRGRGR